MTKKKKKNPWRVVHTGSSNSNALCAEFPSFPTEDKAFTAIENDEAAFGAAIAPRWRPELNENPHARDALELVYSADREPNKLDEITLLLRAQIEAIWALRDQVAGFRPDAREE